LKYFKVYFQGVIREFNEILKSQGLRWNLPSKFPDSIELWKDYQGDDDSSATSSEDNGEATNQNENRSNRNDLSAPLLEDHD